MVAGNKKGNEEGNEEGNDEGGKGDGNSKKVGGSAQNFPKFQNPFFIPKIVQTCSIYSPDGDPKVLLRKNTPP
jgi:hypothetical protein